MLSDNRKLTLIKYQGTVNFIAGLFIEETEKKHYFGFMPTETPTISINMMVVLQKTVLAHELLL